MGIFFNISAIPGKKRIASSPTDVVLGVASVPKHIQGAEASISESSDRWKLESYVPCSEMFGLRENIALTCFPGVDNNSAFHKYYDLGRMDFGYYTKEGLSGADVIQGVRNGRYPTSLVWWLGDSTNAATYSPNFFAGRDADVDGITDYIAYEGLTPEQLMDYDPSFNYDLYSEQNETNTDFALGSEQDGIDRLTYLINQTIATGGHFHNFVHWSRNEGDYAPRYFKRLRNLISGNDVYSGSYLDVMEYYFIRESISSVEFFSNGSVTVNYSQLVPNKPYDKITTPAWIELDLNGTSFAGKDIATSHGRKIRNKGNNVFVVAVDLDYTLTSLTFTISETTTPNYINRNVPVVTRNGNVITSDQPVKMVLYSKLKTDFEIEVLALERYADAFVTSKTLTTTFDLVNRDYYLGFINEDATSGVLQF